MAKDVYCIGIDFGTDSVRAMIVNAQNGEEAASAMFQYPRWKDGLFCNASANQFRQHPLDYIEGMVSSVTTALREAGEFCQIQYPRYLDRDYRIDAGRRG